jgi:hypothetical protein
MFNLNSIKKFNYLLSTDERGVCLIDRNLDVDYKNNNTHGLIIDFGATILKDESDIQNFKCNSSYESMVLLYGLDDSTIDEITLDKLDLGKLKVAKEYNNPKSNQYIIFRDQHDYIDTKLCKNDFIYKEKINNLVDTIVQEQKEEGEEVEGKTGKTGKHEKKGKKGQLNKIEKRIEGLFKQPETREGSFKQEFQEEGDELGNIFGDFGGGKYYTKKSKKSKKSNKLKK